MGNMVGADIGELRELAATFNARAAQLKSIESQLNWRIHSAPWKGHDVSRFVQDWNTRHRRIVYAAAASMIRAAQQIIANADQQETASAVGGLGSGIGLANRTLEQQEKYVHDHPLHLAKDPLKAAAQWAAMDPGLRAAYIEFAPRSVGASDGLPAIDRSKANLNVLANDKTHYFAKLDDDRAALESELHGLRGISSRIPMPGEFFNFEVGGFISLEENARLNHLHQVVRSDETIISNAAAVEHKMSHAAEMGTESYLLIYEPAAFDGDGRSAIAFGNPDLAKNTAVIVPGLNSTMQSEFVGNTDAENLYKQMMRTNGGVATSVVAYMGYDSPELGWDQLNTSVVNGGRAQAGAPLLVADIAALRAAHDSPPTHLTLIGHSYGSTTVSDAATAGVQADDFVLIGSPGMDRAHFADFFGGSGHLYVGAASTDPVSSAPAFDQLGKDPAQIGSGASRFHAESVNRNSNLLELAGGYFEDHSRYFEVDGSGSDFRASESLSSIANISNGSGLSESETTSLRRGDNIDDAEGRHQPQWVGPSGPHIYIRSGLPTDLLNRIG